MKKYDESYTERTNVRSLQEYEERNIKAKTVNEKYEPDIEDSELTLEEVGEAVGKLRMGKAPGLVMIEREVMKYLWKITEEVVRKILSRCWIEGSFPGRWKEGKVGVLWKWEYCK